MKNNKKLHLQLLIFVFCILLGFFLNKMGNKYISEYFLQYSNLPLRTSEMVDENLFWRLGYVHHEDRLHFLGKKTASINQDVKKIRIALFGDSFTYGYEVKTGSDFANLLQQQLGEKYEVINFSANWYSLSQSFILFKTFHKSFDIDITIIGPRNYQKDRLLSFNHTYHIRPDFIHSRHIF